jgi:hypothetical protein
MNMLLPEFDDCFPDDMSLGEARAWLISQKRGAHCPLCTQFVHVYRRHISGATAHLLCLIYAEYGQAWVHVDDFCRLRSLKRGDFCKLEYWGLVVNARGRRPDGGQAGWWQITDHGRDWILRRLRIRETALVFDDKVLDLTGPEISIDDALAKGPFRWDELMAGVIGFGGIPGQTL